MAKYCFFGVLASLLLFSGFVFAAVSASEATNFVQNENHFLASDETTEINPNSKISYGNANYWVVSIVVENSLNGLIAIKDEKPVSLARGDITLTKLFETAYGLRSIALLRSKFLDQWIFNKALANDLGRLSTQLNNEPSELELVKTDLKDFPDLADDVDELNKKVVLLKLDIENAEKEIDETISFEGDFFYALSVEKFSQLQEKYLNSLNLLVELDSKAIDYDNASNKLQQSIARINLSTDIKQNLISLLKPPQELYNLGKISSNASNVEDSLEKLFDSLPSTSKGFAETLATRIKRNDAYNALYSADKDVVNATKKTGQFFSLKDLADYELSADAVERWQNQEEIPKLRENWNSAKSFFNSGKYDLSIDMAKKSKKSAISVYNAGLIAEGSDTTNDELLINAAIILIVILFVLILLRKRKKLFSFFIKNSEEKEGEEVEINAYKRM